MLPRSLPRPGLFLLCALLGPVLARAEVYEYLFSGTIRSRSGWNAAGTTKMNSLYAVWEAQPYELRFLLDTDAALVLSSSGTSKSYYGTGFITGGSVTIGSAGSPLFTATFQSDGMGQNLTVYNDQVLGINYYNDGFNFDFYGEELLSSTDVGDGFSLRGISFKLAKEGALSNGLTSTDIPTSIDGSLFDYRAFAFDVSFLREEDGASGYVGGGAGGPGALPVQAYTISITAIPEPSTYALMGGAVALAGVMLRRRFRRD